MPKKKSRLNQALKKAVKKPQQKEPVWKGPEVDGITQSLLSKFLVCKERFRLYVVEGLTVRDEFQHALEYGNMWHVCEEAFAEQGRGPSWQARLESYAKFLCKKYHLQQEEIGKWYNVCRTQFPIYVDYWKNDSDEKKRTPLLQEQMFCVPYELPSGRIVKLRGKWDSVDLIGKGRNAEIWLQENKTKKDIKEEQLRRQLTFDLQTMFYLVALDSSSSSELSRKGWSNSIFGQGITDINLPTSLKGVRYNVVRRPLAGGKGSIRRHKATKTKPEETQESYYQRLSAIIAEDPAHYFMRWKVAISQEDLERFKREFLNPCLEHLWDWWTQVSYSKKNNIDLYDWAQPSHFRMPYGIYNPLAEGRTTELDEYLVLGSIVGLQRTNNLFPEL